MDHYSIVESPDSKQKGNGTVPEEVAVEASLTTSGLSSSDPAAELILSDVESASAALQPAPVQQPVAFEPPPEQPADLDAALQAVVQKAQYISNASGAAVALRQNGDVVCRAASGSTAPDRGARLEIKSGLTAECLRSGEVMRCDNALLDPRVDLESCKRLGIESIIIMPIRRGGQVEGVLELFSAHAYSFQERDVEMVKGLAEEIGRRLAETEQPALPLPAETPSPPLAEDGLARCSGCGAALARDAVFCTECGVFQEGKPGKDGAWNARLGGRRLLVPAIFVVMALVMAVIPGPRTPSTAPPAAAPARTIAAPAYRPGQAANANATGTGLANRTTTPAPATPNPSIAKDVKQLLGGVSSDFSKLLPVNEKAEPPSAGDPNLKVWVDTRKGFYYCPGDEQYGHTDKGAFMTQRQAESNYYIPALIKPCM